MAAFSTPLSTVREHDIRHMYSYTGREPPQVHRRNYTQKTYPILPLSRRYPRRFYDLYPTMDIGIPRAPAFREAPESEIDIMVKRLRKSITCQSKSGRRRCKEKMERQNERERNIPNKKKTSEEVEEITKRLSRGTKCARRRHKARDDEDLHLPPINVRNFIGQRDWMN